jgi:hypothetical protein
MNIQPELGNLVAISQIPPSPNSSASDKRFFSGRGNVCPRWTGAALAQPRNTRAMPIDPRCRDEIAAAVAAYDRDRPDAPLSRNAALLLAVMFPSEDVCQRSQEAIATEGLNRDRLPAMLRRLVEAGFLSRHRVGGVPDTYRLHLPPVQS